MAVKKSDIAFILMAVGLTAFFALKKAAEKAAEKAAGITAGKAAAEKVTIQRGSIAELTKNPLNLTVGAEWVKRIGGRLEPFENTPGHPKISRFERFDSYYNGMRAGIYQVLRYIRGEGRKSPLTNINDIVSTWAPANENNTAGYIATLEKETGINKKTNIAGNDKAIISVVKSMAKRESGFKADAIIDKAYYNVKNLRL